ncbi:MAG TPA: FAD/NAD(P)-binding protein, partial [Usitatibacter sp.]
SPDSAALLPRQFRVARTRRELADVWTLELQASDGGDPLTFRPGQFTMVYVFGIGEVPLSISGDPAKPDVLVHTVRAVGAVTRAVCAAKKGAVLGVRGPYGEGWPVEAALGRDVVIMAGGLGLAPLRPLIRAVTARRAWFRRVVLLIGARTPADLLFSKELASWRARFDLDVRVTVDSGGAAWNGDVGVITKLLPRATFDSATTTAFVCGPEVMMRFAGADLVQRGVPPEMVFLSMERNMKCAVGVCGHCQFGPAFVCKDGPVFSYARIESSLRIREV